MKEISKAYSPQEHEDKIYKKWEESGLFNPDNLKGDPYSIMMPPPNVTGILHLGHALENSLMDIMTRYQRMNGKKVLLLPGTDHAAVATQARVEKNLIAKGMANPREELGREKLLDEIRDYAENSKSTILNQIRRMGTSCDWSREAYTFDDKRNHAVNTVFEKMYNDGLIERGYRVINWSVKGQSTCSDDELEHKERDAKFYTFKYSKDLPFSIATTRPETKLGDTAIAVNPKDKRYEKYIGQIFEVNVGSAKPLKLKVIGDPHVDPEFGTGALGVTPAHSAVDFEMYTIQKTAGNPIEIIQVIGQDGKMTKEAGKDYQGLTVMEAREKFVKWLDSEKLLEKEEDIVQSVGTSDRFGDVVEALPMTQWFVNVNKGIPGRGKSLKELMKDAVLTGLDNDKTKQVEITPARFEKIYYNWIDNLRDWCISRQVWWGHRIPVWYCNDCDEKIVSSKKSTAITFLRHGEAKCNEAGILNSDINNKDNELTEKGTAGVELAMEKFEDYDVIYASPMLRTKQTAEMVNKKLKLDIKYDERLTEVGVGDFEGKAHTEFLDFRKDSWADWQDGTPQNIESFSGLKKRVFEAIDEIVKANPGKKVLIVTHGDVIRMAQGFHQALTNEEIIDLVYPKTANTLTVKFTGISCDKCNSNNVYQDNDTLDTWFSSGLWTFSTLGWPEQTKDFETFYNNGTSWMQMGHELLFFWHARMILMSAYLLEEIPYKEVYIHGILRDESGKKFSKSLGNGIDPIEMIDKYGTDALRISLISGITPGNDSRFYEEKVEANRNFVNKLWNISRYILMSVDDISYNKSPKSKTLADEWILSALQNVKDNVTRLIDGYNFSQAAEVLREFTVSDFADWYLEMSKVEDDKDDILIHVLVELLKLWHPYIPFVTQAIWDEMELSEELMIAKWIPANKKYVDQNAMDNMIVVKDVVGRIRNLRSEYKVDPGLKVKVMIKAKKEDLIRDNEVVIKSLARLESIEYVDSKPDKSAGAVVEGIEIFLPLEGLLDIDKEKGRLVSEIDSLEKYYKGLNGKLSNKNFVDNAPKEVVAGEQAKLVEAKEKMDKLSKQLEEIS